jgi:hypothetical protein
MKIKMIAIAIVAVLGFTACGNSNSNSEASKEESTDANRQLDQYLKAQPVPFFNSSQLRQNLIDIQTAQANATATTSFFFNVGVENPVHACPSIGFPIPGTFQLTSPERGAGNRNGGYYALPQLEANGVYTGDTSSTTVICVDAEGKGYANYWEGYVNTVAGPAEWNSDTKTVELTGTPSADFSTGDE